MKGGCIDKYFIYLSYKKKMKNLCISILEFKELNDCSESLIAFYLCISILEFKVINCYIFLFPFFLIYVFLY